MLLGWFVDVVVYVVLVLMLLSWPCVAVAWGEKVGGVQEKGVPVFGGRSRECLYQCKGSVIGCGVVSSTRCAFARGMVFVTFASCYVLMCSRCHASDTRLGKLVPGACGAGRVVGGVARSGGTCGCGVFLCFFLFSLVALAVVGRGLPPWLAGCEEGGVGGCLHPRGSAMGSGANSLLVCASACSGVKPLLIFAPLYVQICIWVRNSGNLVPGACGARRVVGGEAGDGGSGGTGGWVPFLCFFLFSLFALAVVCVDLVGMLLLGVAERGS